MLGGVIFSGIVLWYSTSNLSRTLTRWRLVEYHSVPICFHFFSQKLINSIGFQHFRFVAAFHIIATIAEVHWQAMLKFFIRVIMVILDHASSKFIVPVRLSFPFRFLIRRWNFSSLGVDDFTTVIHILKRHRNEHLGFVWVIELVFLLTQRNLTTLLIQKLKLLIWTL